MKRRRKIAAPRLLFWNVRDQARFIENVERLGGVVNDLERVLEPAKRKKKAAAVNGTAAAWDVGVIISDARVAAQCLIDGFPDAKQRPESVVKALNRLQLIIAKGGAT